MTRSDPTWFTLRAGLRDLLLQEHYHPYEAFKRFSNATAQSPQMVSLIGHRTKTLAMRKLRFGARAPENIRGEIHLTVDEYTTTSQWPVIFADCELHNASTIDHISTDRAPGNITRRPLEWHRNMTQPWDHITLAYLFYSKVIAPFSNIICIFAEDIGGMTAVIDVLATWATTFGNCSTDLPLSTRPRVIVLTCWEGFVSFDEVSSTKAFIQQLKDEVKRRHRSTLKATDVDKILAAQYSGITVAALPALDSSSRTWRSLRARLLQYSSTVQIAKESSQVAFSCEHVLAFFHLSCNHFCSSITTPFNFIQASRSFNPIPKELLSHTQTFLKCVDPLQVLNFAVPVIASAMVFDAYPVGMHGFAPPLVFKQFFQQICLRLDPFLHCDQQVSTAQLSKALEIAFCSYAFRVLNLQDNDVNLHRGVLGRFKKAWKTIYSNETCFTCLARAPENTLQCHHALCGPCTMAHGRPCENEPWAFWLVACPLCGEPNQNKFIHKPDTAGIRAIISEGGGIRGIVPLAFLKELEMAVRLPMGIQEHFDIAFGSSSGSLIILGLFSNKWSVDHCIKQFRHLSTLAFRKRAIFRLPLISGISSRIIEVFLSFLTDSRYSSHGITNALKDAFGNDLSLFATDSNGTKIGVVATTTDQSATCLFTNYNGPGKRSQECGYNLIRPQDLRGELRIWEAARASTAAPPYFPSFQGYQDGGLGGHNNPINLALWEQNTIWDRQNKQPDIVLSLGTGFKRTLSVTTDSKKRLSFFRTRCVPRLFRSFMNFFVGETRWQELQNSLQPQARDRYHRMNIEFYGEEPELDDIQALPSLEQQAKFHALSSTDVLNCADNLLAALFYLELSTYPEFKGTLFICQGFIRCRIGPYHRALRPLMARLREKNAHFYLDFDQKVPCFGDNTTVSTEDGVAFVCPVVFRVMSLDDLVDIKIDGITKRARSISNCPYQVNALIKDQGLDCVFGSRNQRKRTQTEIVKRPKRAKISP